MRHVAQSIAAGAVVACLSVSAPAGPYEDGFTAFESGDYTTALQKWQSPAEQGNADAQFGLGQIYRRGLGAPPDQTKAVNWYWLAAEQGHAMAQHNLGVTYATGSGASQDYVLAYMWFDLAAQQGLMLASTLRDRTADFMSPDEIAEAKRLARAWEAKTK